MQLPRVNRHSFLNTQRIRGGERVTCALLLMGYLLQIPQTQAMMQEKEKQQEMDGISLPSTSLPSHGPCNRDLVKEQLRREAEENYLYEWAQ